MFALRQTEQFQNWLEGGEVSEMRVDVGPGYRLYFTRKGALIIVMLAGGDKSNQARDIKRAQRLLQQLDVQP
jgi:putative addiction module killer protein